MKKIAKGGENVGGKAEGGDLRAGKKGIWQLGLESKPHSVEGDVGERRKCGQEAIELRHWEVRGRDMPGPGEEEGRIREVIGGEEL